MKKTSDISLLQRCIEDIQIQPGEVWAIYGTGNAATFILKTLKEFSLEDSIKYMIDRDDKVTPGNLFCSIPVVKLSDVKGKLDGIFVAAYVNHRIIEERIRKTLNEEQSEKIKVINFLNYNTKADRLEYVDFVEKQLLKQNSDFVDWDDNAFVRRETDTKTIAWYLPQFHQLEVNNKFHGQGFTEWTNTTRAIPMFTGHYQPHIPYDVGYYDLLNIDTFKRQIELAKHYGVYGFCFHYYWFSGKRVMEKPLELLLENKTLDIPFCLNWATENWSTLWDGGSKDIIYEQKIDVDEAEQFMKDIVPFLMDSRYIRIDGKPVLVIYRVNQFEKEKVIAVFHKFREIARSVGFPDLYIMITNSFYFEDDVTEWGADALVEFPPHCIDQLMDQYEPDGYVNPYFQGSIFEVSSFIENQRYMLKHKSKKYFRSALTSWDNTARKALSNASIMYGLSPNTCKKWLKDIICESKQIHSSSENIVFLNSWNEWGEGSHLEPDMKYGYAWLQACKEALDETR